MNLKNILLSRITLIISIIVAGYIFIFNPGLFGYTRQYNAVWMIIYADISLFILVNMWNHVYLDSNTVCPAGSLAMTTDGYLERHGIWAIAFGGNSIRTAGYNTNIGAIPGLHAIGRNPIIALATHCHEVGGQEGSKKRHLFITGHTEKYDPSNTPFEIKNSRDHAQKPPDEILLSYFSSQEYDKFKEFTYEEAGGKKTVNLNQSVMRNITLDMELDMYVALLNGNPQFIKQRIEGFNCLLRTATHQKKGWFEGLIGQESRTDQPAEDTANV